MKEKRKWKKDSCRGREVENSGIFPPPDFMSRLCPLPRHFMVRVVAILCEHGVARSWNASPLPSFSSISRTILRDTRQLDVLLQRDTYIYIYIIDSNTNASALCTRSGGINYYKRSSFSFEVARRTMKKMKFLFFVLCVKRILRYLLSLERKMIKYLLSLFVDHRLNG